MLFARKFGGEINHEKERVIEGFAYEILHFKSGLSVLALKRSHGAAGGQRLCLENERGTETSGEVN